MLVRAATIPRRYDAVLRFAPLRWVGHRHPEFKCFSVSAAVAFSVGEPEHDPPAIYAGLIGFLNRERPQESPALYAGCIY